jgi:hypothetical protein
MTGSHRFFSDRFRRFHNNRTFIFVDTFGFPFFYPYPYPYYGYYPDAYYGYSDYGYGYGNPTVVEVQRRLARAGYYHGAIDGIMGPRTRRAIRAYERDHNMPAYGVIDGQRLRTMGLVWSSLNREIVAGGRSGLADAHRDDGKRFVVRADEKLTFLELEVAIRACGFLS